MQTQNRGRILTSVLVLLAGLLGGLLAGLLWTAPSESDPEQTGQDSGRVRLIIDRLEAEQQDLKSTLADIRQQWSEQSQLAAANSDRLRALNSELDRQRLLAGLVPVTGPGVLVMLADSSVEIPPGMDANAYIVHEYDLRDTVNLLWTAGAEAIAINEERMVTSSSIYCVGSTVMVNDTRLSPPYEISAIGNPRTLHEHLLNPSYLVSLKEKHRLYGLGFQVEVVSRVSLPGYSGSLLVHHATLGE